MCVCVCVCVRKCMCVCARPRVYVYNVLVVPFQQLLKGPMNVLLCERVNDLCHSLFHILNCLITTASELRE